MASAPAVRTAPSGARAGTGFRGALGSRAGLIAPTARRPNPRASPQPVRAGEALDWENDDFVPAAKAKKNKKKPKAKKPEPKEAPSPPAAGGEALDWENDDFVPAGKAKKNKKKPKKGGGGHVFFHVFPRRRALDVLARRERGLELAHFVRGE